MGQGNKWWNYIRSYRFNCLLIRNFLITLYSVTENSIADNAKNSLIRVRDVMENVFMVSNRIAAKLSLEDHVRLFMVSSGFVDFYNGNLYKDILKSINMYMDVNSYIDSVYIYSESNASVINNQSGSTTGEEERRDGTAPLSKQTAWYSRSCPGFAAAISPILFRCYGRYHLTASTRSGRLS